MCSRVAGADAFYQAHVARTRLKRPNIKLHSVRARVSGFILDGPGRATFAARIIRDTVIHAVLAWLVGGLRWEGSENVRFVRKRTHVVIRLAQQLIA